MISQSPAQASCYHISPALGTSSPLQPWAKIRSFFPKLLCFPSWYFITATEKITNTENGASVGQMSPESSMGTKSCGAGPLLPSRHSWSSGSVVERVERERWERVDSGPQSYTLEVICKRSTSLNPCASNSPPSHDPPFPSCTSQSISGDASVTVSAECSALAPSSASFLSSAFSSQLASCYFTNGESWILFLQ